MVVTLCNTWVRVRQFNGVIHGERRDQVFLCITWKWLEAIVHFEHSFARIYPNGVCGQTSSSANATIFGWSLWWQSKAKNQSPICGANASGFLSPYSLLPSWLYHLHHAFVRPSKTNSLPDENAWVPLSARFGVLQDIITSDPAQVSTLWLEDTELNVPFPPRLYITPLGELEIMLFIHVLHRCADSLTKLGTESRFSM